MNLRLKAGEKVIVSFDDTDREIEISYLEGNVYGEPFIGVQMPEYCGSKGIDYHETFPKVEA